MLLTTLTAAALCLSCDQPAQPAKPRLATPEPLVDLGADGCARFQVRVTVGSTPRIEGLYNTGACPGGALKLLSDTTPIFSSATGALRIALRVKNEGTTTVIPRLRLRFFEDSVRLYSATGQPLGWSTDIVAYQPDSSAAAERLAFWFFDTYMAASGQPQVLPPGATSQRRWIEFRGTNWSAQIRLKLAMEGQELRPATALPADSTPSTHFADRSNWITNPTFYGGTILRNVLEVYFNPGTSLAQRQAALTSVGGGVIGGLKLFADGDGSYFVLIPAATSNVSQLLTAKNALEANPSVRLAAFVEVGGVKEQYLRPVDGAGFAKADWNALPATAAGSNWYLEDLAGPMAWGCTTGSTIVRVATVDHGYYPSMDMPAVAGAPAPNFFTDPVTQSAAHATRTASVLAARGNNSQLITGVMWTSDLRIYERLSTTTGMPPAGLPVDSMVDFTQHWISRAARDGAQIINVSLTLGWPLWKLVGTPHPSDTTSPSLGNGPARIRNTARRLEAV